MDLLKLFHVFSPKGYVYKNNELIPIGRKAHVKYFNINIDSYELYSAYNNYLAVNQVILTRSYPLRHLSTVNVSVYDIDLLRSYIQQYAETIKNKKIYLFCYEYGTSKRFNSFEDFINAVNTKSLKEIMEN